MQPGLGRSNSPNILKGFGLGFRHTWHLQGLQNHLLELRGYNDVSPAYRGLAVQRV